MTGEPEAEGTLLWRLSAALTGPAGEVRSALERAAAVHDARVIEEVLLQAYLFVGFPAVIDAFDALRSLVPDARRDDRTSVPEETDRGAPEEGASDEGDLGDDPGLLVERGRSLCARVYGSAYPRLRHAVRALHPDLDRWMVRDGYGKVLSRPGLDAIDRELCIVALLAADDRPRQLHSHLRGALNVGARPADVGRALEVGLEVGLAVGGNDPRAARELWEGVREAWQGCS